MRNKNEEPEAEDIDGTEGFYLFHPGERNNVEYQILFKNLNAFDCAIEIINYDIASGTYTDYSENQKSVAVLSQCYRYLAKLAYR